MKKLERPVLLFLTLTTTARLAMADGGDACGALGCAAGGILYLVILAVCLAIPIVLDVIIIKWIGKDARARGMANAETIKWLGLLNWLGLVIYLLQRPQTNVPQ